jgi:hypothetical protein
VNYIMAVAEIQEGFDRVVRIDADEGAQKSVTLTSASGHTVSVPIDTGFLRSGESS